MFVDRVFIQFSAGKGGNGVVAWRREKYIPKGGPAGGNGGKGGSIILEADTQISSLDWFRHHRLIKAENGGSWRRQLPPRTQWTRSYSESSLWHTRQKRQ